MNKRNILVFSQNYYPSSLADSVRIIPVIDYLLQHEFIIHLLTQTQESLKLRKGQLNISLLKFVKPNNTDKSLIRLIKEVLLGVEIFIRILFSTKCEYYYFTSPPFISCYIGSLCALLKGGKIIFDVRDIYPDIYVKQGLIRENGYIHKSITFLEKFIYRKSYVVLAATAGLYEIIKSRTQSTTILFRNGYSKYFKISQNKNQNFSIIFHGNLGKFQNIELLIEVIREINVLAPLIKFYAVGSGPKEVLLNSFKSPNFDFYGRLSNEKTAELVNQCHIGLSLRDDSQISIDAFPVKLYEYIGAGLPSIATPICEGGEVLSNLKIGYNVPNDKTEIINLILSLYKNDQLYNSMMNNIMACRESFGREKTVKDVFDQIL